MRPLLDGHFGNLREARRQKGVEVAFAKARGRPVLCFAHVTNQMGQIERDFEKALQMVPKRSCR